MSAVNADLLFQPIKIGGKDLKHRIVYAPLTRSRAINNVPVPQAALYYSQRATDGGLMISEATAISPEAYGLGPHTPGIHTVAQVEAWKPVVKAVHNKGATFFLQLWHVGRGSHNDFQPGGAAPVAPSAIGITDKWEVYTTKGGPYKYPMPRALTEAEIPGIVEAYAQGARNAIAAGFDGVEIPAANGYLLAQFISSLTNQRTDKYGGTLENRARLLFEVVDAVTEAVGASRLGIRLSPFNKFLDCVEPEPYDTYGYIIKALNKYGLAYLHMVEPRVLGLLDVDVPEGETLQPFREAFDGPFIAAGGFKPDTAAEAVGTHAADLVAFGRWFLSNPDLVRRIKLGAPLTKYNRDTFYTQDPVVGYTDYPFLT
ncbi:N-ethylmaleimide reductase [Monoraphidium neglectum]|uniref:N-ethylmaleimide reductase n=1 Tax=Monoraphidium neglectum TaxID=145388 RepID=A0A0D2LA85_9CHLO|nr:N-ethylmaleimide reductase [Monoraphidium neglectum]KIZ03664.1 N-ethylmaleimide reductase [Monoraphidium neglectum]|eukprot:XP_013902683.1 N-ethylmaleimide reductase [Monoraphidium neglectum]